MSSRVRLPPRPQAERRPPDRDRWSWLFQAMALFCGAIGGLFAIVLVLGALGPRVLADVTESVDASVILPEDTDFEQLRERSYVYAADGSLLATLHDEIAREVVSLDSLPDHVWQAVVAVEDRRFFEHDGYDVEGMGRALVTNLQRREISQGGSTITQQLAKLNFLDASQTLERKFAELLHAMALERELSKEELLERYLNEIYFGGGAYGIQAAAEQFFGVDAARLEPEQAALLAGSINSPGAFDPRGNPDRALARRAQALNSMASAGYLDAREAKWLAQSDLGVVEASDEGVREPYVVEAVKRRLLHDPDFGATYDERYARLFGGGLEIHTTIDPELQDIARAAVETHFPDDAPTAAIASIEPGSGAIVALHGGRDFQAEQFDLATQGRKQPGSAFKPFVMLEALRQGFPPDLMFQANSPMTFDLGERRDPWEVRNYGGRSFATADMRQATSRSINTYYAQLIQLVGVAETAALTEELGIDPAAYGSGPYEAISIGGLDRGVTPLEMASAYGTLANEGSRAEPYLLARVVEDGEDVWTHEAEERRVLEEAVSAFAVDLLRETVEQGTGTAARIDGWEVAGKTGTTNNNFAAWFVGFTPSLSTAVWVGHAAEDVEMPDATGGGTAAPVWHDFMVEALEGYEPTSFPEPDEDALAALFEDEETDVPDLRGMSESEALRALGLERLTGDVRRVDSEAPRGAVVGQRPRPGTSVPVGTEVVVEVSTGRPPPSEDDDDDEEDESDDNGDDDNDNGDDDNGDDDNGDDDNGDDDDDNGGDDDDDDDDNGDDDEDDQARGPRLPGDGDRPGPPGRSSASLGLRAT